MTPEDLYKAISANPDAKARADAGDDSGCAAVISAALPFAVSEFMLTERGVFAAFADPIDAETVMQTLEAVAVSELPIAPVMKRAIRWMQPNNGGVDVGNAALRAVLDGLLRPEHAATIKALAEVPQVITADQVSEVFQAERDAARLEAFERLEAARLEEERLEAERLEAIESEAKDVG